MTRNLKSPEQNLAEFNNSLGIRIRYARNKAKLTQAELSEKMGFKDRQTLSDIEQGKRSVKVDELIALSGFLNTSVEDLTDPLNIQGQFGLAVSAEAGVAPVEVEEASARASAYFSMFHWLTLANGESFPVMRFKFGLAADATEAEVAAAAQELQDSRYGREARLLHANVLYATFSSEKGPRAIKSIACHLPRFDTIIVNRELSKAEQKFEIAKQIFKLLTWDCPQKDFLSEVFAKHYLVNEKMLDDNFGQRSQVPAAAILKAAAYSDVCPLLIAQHLLSLGRTSAQTVQELKEAPPRKVRDDKKHSLSQDFMALLEDALESGILSNKKAARVLGLSLLELDTLFRAHGFKREFDI